jgi:hypothetical protein
VWFREGEGLATVITTNLTGEDLRARLSDRVVDRLRGQWASLFAVTGENFRSGAARA